MYVIRLCCVALAVCLLLATASSVQASAISIDNYSFESPNQSNGSIAPKMMPTPWAISQSDNYFLCDRNPGGAGVSGWVPATPDTTDAEQFVLVYGMSTYVNGFSNVLSTNLAANTTYTLTVDVGQRNATMPTGVSIDLGYGSTFGSNLLTGTWVQHATPAQGTWATWERTFATGASVPSGQALRVDLSVAMQAGVPDVLFDNVRLDGIITPEPGTLLLLSTGLLGLLAYAWRKRKYALAQG